MDLWILDASNFIPRWQCGNWPEWLGWTIIVCDLVIWAAYTSIPLYLLVTGRQRGAFDHKSTGWIVGLFIGFILLCGFSHATNALMFFRPVYRFLALVYALTAVFSIGTAFTLPHLCQHLSVRWEGDNGTEPKSDDGP